MKAKIKNNKDRSNRIKKILGLRGFDTDKEYYRVADVICDLMHYCDYNKYFKPDQNKIDFNNEYNAALEYYYFEREHDK